VAFADEVYVVDSFSTDRTVEIAEAAGARVEQHEYVNSAQQKNWAIPRASHEWILLVDADERVTPDLQQEVLEILERGPESDGYWIPRANYFRGRRLRHGGWESDRVIRLFHRDRARYQEREVHEEIDLPEPLPTLRAHLRHYTFRSFDQYLPKMERYGRWGASQAFRDGRRASALTVLGHTLVRFLRMYLLRLGFLDGGDGLVLALLASYSVFLKYARLWELTRLEKAERGA
jgi:glycosyltransferase involved in cell wall biosynthesis